MDLSVGGLREPTPEEVSAAEAEQRDKDHPLGWRYLPGISGFGTSISEATTFPSDSTYPEAWVGEGTVDWSRLTWEQNPTQYHIVNALADLPILEYRPALVAKGNINLIVPDRLPRAIK